MELHELLPAVVKTLMGLSLGCLFLLMILVDKIRLNGKEKGGRNLVITLGVFLVATLLCSLLAIVFLYDYSTDSLSIALIPSGAKLFAALAALSFVPVLVALFKVGGLLLRKKQKHA